LKVGVEQKELMRIQKKNSVTDTYVSRLYPIYFMGYANPVSHRL